MPFLGGFTMEPPMPHGNACPWREFPIPAASGEQGTNRELPALGE
jgi:hypothetical protein